MIRFILALLLVFILLIPTSLLLDLVYGTFPCWTEIKCSAVDVYNKIKERFL